MTLADLCDADQRTRDSRVARMAATVGVPSVVSVRRLMDMERYEPSPEPIVRRVS